eukprot:13259005-Alexandrium_andersonii.AAC.1
MRPTAASHIATWAAACPAFAKPNCAMASPRNSNAAQQHPGLERCAETSIKQTSAQTQHVFWNSSLALVYQLCICLCELRPPGSAGFHSVRRVPPGSAGFRRVPPGSA